MNITSLDRVDRKQKAIIKSISDCDPEKQRLYDMGLTAGSIVIPLFSSPFAGVTAYKVKGTVIAMRKKNARNINVSIYRDDAHFHEESPE